MKWDVIGRVQQFPVTTARKAPVGTFLVTSDRSKPFSTIDIASKINYDHKYWGGVLAGNGRIYFVPHNADNIGQLDPSTGVFSTMDISGTISHDAKYLGGVLASNGRVYFVPRNADNIGVLHCASPEAHSTSREASAHTCFNVLVLPEYGSKGAMERNLAAALNHTDDGLLLT